MPDNTDMILTIHNKISNVEKSVIEINGKLETIQEVISHKPDLPEVLQHIDTHVTKGVKTQAEICRSVLTKDSSTKNKMYVNNSAMINLITMLLKVVGIALIAGAGAGGLMSFIK